MMKYMLLIYTDEKPCVENERQDTITLSHQLNSQGKYLAASPLQSVATASTVRVREGKRQITDGPFAETREQLGGFFLIDVANLDEAIDFAGRLPVARRGSVEVRPVKEMEGLPPASLR